MSSVVVGCIAAVLLSSIQSLGITLQRKSHVIPYHHELTDETVVELRRDTEIAEEPSYRHNCKRNLWLAGFAMFIIANIFGSLIQLTTLPLIILSPLQSIGLIFNSIFSCWLLPGEHFTYKLGLGTLIIAVGAFIIAYNGGGSVGSNPPTADERFALLIEKFTSHSFLSWWVFTFVAIGVLLKVNWTLSRRIEESNALLRLKRHRAHIRLSVELCEFIKGLLYGIISGTLTAHTFLFAKSAVDILVEEIFSKGQPKTLSTYVLSVCLLAATLCIVGLQVVSFNLGLLNILTSILYPLCFLVYNMVNLINDVLFNKLLTSGLMSISQFSWVILGLLGVLLGVVMISWDSAFGINSILLKDESFLLTAKFPYDSPGAERRLLSYEESELIKLFFGEE